MNMSRWSIPIRAIQTFIIATGTSQAANALEQDQVFDPLMEVLRPSL
jgi:hypothetical protein